MLSPLLQSVVAVVALASYLAAACLDCEPADTRFGPAGPLASGVATHGLASAPPATAAAGHGDHDHGAGHDSAGAHASRRDAGQAAHRTPVTPRTVPRARAEDSPAQARGHGAHGSASGHAHAHAHAHAHVHAHAHAEGHDPSPVRRAPTASAERTRPADAAPPVSRAVRAASDFAEWKATCLCGCGETRARVGGGTSRLGAVVPGVHVATLPEAIDVPGPGPEDASPIDVFETHDPVPV